MLRCRRFRTGNQNRGMTRECLSEIWSLYRHAGVIVRISYRVRQVRSCRVFRLERVQEMED